MSIALSDKLLFGAPLGLGGHMPECKLCPRKCNTDRENGVLGYCGAGANASVAHVTKHFFEEPPISGNVGSGAIFFGGCNLGCVFCQNRDISTRNVGDVMSDKELSELILRVADSGVHNVNLVTPTPHVYAIARALERVKHLITVPVVYNTGAYETVDAIRMMDGLADVYLPDIKYASDKLAVRYSNALGYTENAFSALEEMLRQQGRYIEENGLVKRGVIVRHLCLPSCSEDSRGVIDRLSAYLEKYDFRISLMSQYTPEFLGAEGKVRYKEISRRITTLEYNRLARLCEEYGFNGYFQERSSASKAYTPDFKSGKKGF